MIENIKDKLPLNWALLSNPANWLTVLLMVFIAGLAISFVTHSANSNQEN